MSRAFPAGGPSPADGSDARVLQARELVAKSLGDNSRDLVFVPITPCTVWDTRFATDPNASGLITDSSTKRFYSHLDGAGGSFANWGGNPVCNEAAENAIGMRPFAVMMTVYVNDPTGNGWLTFYRDGDPDPSQATISVYYSPGPTRTQTVISKSSRGHGSGAYDVAVTGRFASANASASVVGYFLKPVNIVLPNSTATTGNIMKGGTRFLHNYGTDNTFAGSGAGNFAMTGTGNTAVGWTALTSNDTGGQNVAVGQQALRLSTSGHHNSAIGSSALRQTTTGIVNTAVGSTALYSNTTGSYNVAVGPDALFDNVGGNSNIALGLLAGTDTTGSNNILIGNRGAAGEGGTMRIGDSLAHTRAFVAGIRGVTTGSANAVAVLIDSDGQLGTINSSRHAKDHVADMDAASDALMKLRPVTFHYKAHEPSARSLQYGLIAEEVAEVYPNLVAQSPDGRAETVMYQFLPPMLLNEAQKQQKRIAELERQVAEMAAAIARLQAVRHANAEGN